jgi:hypothetical protein
MCAVTGLAWSVAYRHSVNYALAYALLMIFRDYLLTGIVVASLLWYHSVVCKKLIYSLTHMNHRLVANKLLLAPPSHTTPADSAVEWGYAFDVHTNAFFPFFLTLYIAQLFLLPVILKERWVCLLVGNTLYLAA